MSEDLWIELIMIALGIYFIICATWKREFFLYKLSVKRMTIVFEERFAHLFYQILGVILIAGGVLQALDIWVL